jgi:hypothetical protein
VARQQQVDHWQGQEEGREEDGYEVQVKKDPQIRTVDSFVGTHVFVFGLVANGAPTHLHPSREIGERESEIWELDIRVCVPGARNRFFGDFVWRLSGFAGRLQPVNALLDSCIGASAAERGELGGVNQWGETSGVVLGAECECDEEEPFNQRIISSP